MSRNWRGGSTRAWRRTRLLVLARDAALGYRCRAHEDGWCDRAHARPHTCTSRPTHAHHTHGKRTSGDDPAFIVSSCRECNQAIGDPAAAPDPPPRPVTRW